MTFLLTQQFMNSSQVHLSKEEIETLQAEGLPIPTTLPLTKVVYQLPASTAACVTRVCTGVRVYVIASVHVFSLD